jgi:hypothetical protein
MPVVNVHRYVITGDQVGGTVEIDDLDLTNGLTVEMRNPPFSSAGTWTIIAYTTGVNVNSGTVAAITIVPPSGFTAGTPTLDAVNKKIKVVLTAV